MAAVRGFDRAAEELSHLRCRMPFPASGSGHPLSAFRELETIKPLYQPGFICQPMDGHKKTPHWGGNSKKWNDPWLLLPVWLKKHFCAGKGHFCSLLISNITGYLTFFKLARYSPNTAYAWWLMMLSEPWDISFFEVIYSSRFHSTSSIRYFCFEKGNIHGLHLPSYRIAACA